MSPGGERGGAAGFTLIEVMVALAIVALGMIAVNAQLGQYAASATHIEEKTLASWIATNKLAELSVQDAWPEVGDDEEEIEFAGRLWRCRTEISETQVPNLRRVDVYVSFADEPDSVVHSVMGLLEPPPPRGFVPPSWLPPALESEG